MYNKIFLAIILLSFGLLFSQSNTEVFLFDLANNNGTPMLSNGKNISNNDGYDNQPSFISDNKILFSSTRNKQTDIVQYQANFDSKIWLCFTEGGEYSPQKVSKRK